jgi:hypothetical protein
MEQAMRKIVGGAGAFVLGLWASSGQAQAEGTAAAANVPAAGPEIAALPPAPAAAGPQIDPNGAPSDAAREQAAPIPVTPPPPPEPPPAKDIQQLGDARWADGIGFVQPAAAGDSPGKDEAGSAGGFKIPAIADVTLNAFELRAGIGMLSLNPTNDDGRTADDTATTLLELPLDMRAEFRHASSLIAPWFDAHYAFVTGKRSEEVAGSESGRVMKVQGFRFRGRLGIDVHPAPAFGVGPLIGYGHDIYEAQIQREDGSGGTDAEMESDGGILYGAHARFRTKETASERARFYADTTFTWRKNTYITGQYASLELGLRSGNAYFLGWAERRLGASGSFSFVGADRDVTSLSQAVANSMPIEQRLGLGISLLM